MAKLQNGCKKKDLRLYREAIYLKMKPLEECINEYRLPHQDAIKTRTTGMENFLTRCGKIGFVLLPLFLVIWELIVDSLSAVIVFMLAIASILFFINHMN